MKACWKCVWNWDIFRLQCQAGMRIRQWILSSMRSSQSMSLLSHVLFLGVSCGLLVFPYDFPITIVYMFLISPCMLHVLNSSHVAIYTIIIFDEDETFVKLGLREPPHPSLFFFVSKLNQNWRSGGNIQNTNNKHYNSFKMKSRLAPLLEKLPPPPSGCTREAVHYVIFCSHLVIYSR
jgi:hypothetical protein